MNNNISNEVSSVALCWKIIRLDGIILYFTNHDKNIKHNGITYIANTSLNPSELSQSIKIENGGFEIDGIIDNKIIKKYDLISGLYDNAEIHYLLINTENLSKPALLVRYGYINTIKIIGETFIAEIGDILSKASHNICKSYSMLCRTSFGDSNCKINLSKISSTSTVEQVISEYIFSDQKILHKIKYYNTGTIQFISGANKNSKFKIKKHIHNKIALTTIPDFPITIGDKYKITPGCNKTIEVCFSKFNNTINFRGEPYIPINNNGSRVVAK